jgi:hypothetical protein
MAKENLSNLFKIMGGAQATADRINALIALTAHPHRLATIHIAHEWTQRGVSSGWHQWILAAALDTGLSARLILELCPELAPAATLAQWIAAKVEVTA